MKEKAWVVTVNAEKAKFYRVIRVGELEEVASLVHPEMNKRPIDLEADSLGRNNPRVGNGSNTYQPKTTAKDKKDQLFAKMVSEELDRALTNRAFQNLYIISEPHFLGVLKKELSSQVEGKIDRVFTKDLVEQNPNQIWDLVPLVC